MRDTGADAAHEAGDQASRWLSSIANSSAMVSGLLTSGSACPSTAILARLVWRANRARDNPGGRHQAVGILVMLVDADAVEASSSA